MDLKVYFPGGKKVYADIFGQTIETDQPVYAGGDGSAPAPFTLFLASLGTCAGIYVLSFLQTRGLPTENVTITQSHQFDPVTHLLTGVKMTIELPPEIPAKYHKALIRSAEKCAVKKVMELQPSFEIEVAQE